MTILDQEIDRMTVRANSRPLSIGYFALWVRVLDLLIVGVTGLAVYGVYVAPRHDGILDIYSSALFIVVAIAALIFQQFGLYAPSYLLKPSKRAPRLLLAWLVTCAFLLALAFALKISDHFSRVWAFTWLIATPGAITLTQMLIYRWVMPRLQAGRFAQRSVIVGEGEVAARLCRHFSANKDPLTKLMGIVSPSEEDASPAKVEGTNSLGDLDDLILMIRQGQVDQVFLALSWHEEKRLRSLIQILATTPVTIRLAPDLFAYQIGERAFTSVGHLPMLNLIDRPLSSPADQFMKSAEDKIIGGLLLFLLSPLLLTVSLAVKLTSKGPVFFKQKRYGFNNQLIEVWKFRSMYVDQTDWDASQQTTKDDPRVTPLGRFLRRSSIDELPQLFNVVGGSMSLVGPRPHALATKAQGRLFEQIVEGYAARHRVKPGITGWAQINGWRGETDTEEKIERRVEFDLYYIDNWSLTFDLWILFRTAFVIFNDEQAY